jgi:hypothetical protein
MRTGELNRFKKNMFPEKTFKKKKSAPALTLSTSPET